MIAFRVDQGVLDTKCVPKYGFSMTVTKRNVSLSLDHDLVAELEHDAEALSVQVNAAVRSEVSARRRQRAPVAFLDELDRQEGTLDSDADEAQIARFMRLLGGEA